MPEFKDMLAYYRKRDGYSQRELAKKIGVSASTIGMYESGKRFPEHEIEEALAKIFNVSLNDLRGIVVDYSYHLDDAEFDIVMEYRKADDDTKKMISEMISYFITQSKKDK